MCTAFSISLVGEFRMDVLAHCRAMAAFCRQRVASEDENDTFWLREAEEWDKLLSEYASQQPEIQTVRTTRIRSGLADDQEGAQLSGQ
jgi:hypothetical protein